MIKVEGWLPIGSVVHLAGKDGLIVIIGCMQRQASNGRLWDYLGFPYPVGIADLKDAILFDKEGIDRVQFIGLQNSDGEEFQEFLASKEDEFYAAKAEAAEKIAAAADAEKATETNEG